MAISLSYWISQYEVVHMIKFVVYPHKADTLMIHDCSSFSIVPSQLKQVLSDSLSPSYLPVSKSRGATPQ